MKAALSLTFVLCGWLAVAAAEEALSPIGKEVENFKLRDYRGAERSLQDFGPGRRHGAPFDGQQEAITFLLSVNRSPGG